MELFAAGKSSSRAAVQVPLLLFLLHSPRLLQAAWPSCRTLSLRFCSHRSAAVMQLFWNAQHYPQSLLSLFTVKRSIFSVCTSPSTMIHDYTIKDLVLKAVRQRSIYGVILQTNRKERDTMYC